MRRANVEFDSKRPDAIPILIFADSVDYIRGLEGNADGCTVGCGGVIHAFPEVSYQRMKELVLKANDEIWP